MIRTAKGSERRLYVCCLKAIKYTCYAQTAQCRSYGTDERETKTMTMLDQKKIKLNIHTPRRLFL